MLRDSLQKGIIIMDSIALLCLISREKKLGEILRKPQKLSGGLQHSMFELETQKGHYAVKLLNPSIMRRPDACANFRAAEAAETLAEARGLSILPAMILDGCKMQECAGRYYYLFPFFDGKAKNPKEVSLSDVIAIAEFLRDLHGIVPETQKDISYVPPVNRFDFPKRLLDQGQHQILKRFLQIQPKIWHWKYKAHQLFSSLPHQTALCHRDLDAKNVLWKGTDFRVIDLECMGWGNPWQEAMDSALNWCGYDDGNGDPKKFLSFWESYLGPDPKVIPHWESLLWCRTNYLDWLEYNLERALGSQGPEAAVLGCQQALLTLDRIDTLFTFYPEILAILQNRFPWDKCTK